VVVGGAVVDVGVGTGVDEDPDADVGVVTEEELLAVEFAVEPPPAPEPGTDPRAVADAFEALATRRSTRWSS